MNLNHIDRQLNLKTYQLYLKKAVSISESQHKMLDRLIKTINVELLQINNQIHDQTYSPLPSVPPDTLQDFSANFMKLLTEG